MKKSKILLFILAMVCALSLFAFAACDNEGGTHTQHVDADKDGKCDECGEDMPDATEETPVYTGLFTYAMTRDGQNLKAYLVLNEDGTFYYASDMLNPDIVGTYEYNADKTQITLKGDNDQQIDGEYTVNVVDGEVVIYQIPYLAGNTEAEDGLYRDDFKYDTVNDPPAQQPIEIVSFFAQSDESSTLTIQTGNHYMLMLNDPEIISSGTYTMTQEGDEYTYTFTDTLGEVEAGASYIFTFTYTEENGYSDLLLKGTGIDEEGIIFLHELPKLLILEGEVQANNVTERATLTLMGSSSESGTFRLEFTAFGQPGAVVTGTWTFGYDAEAAAMKTTCTVTDGAQKDWIEGGIIVLIVANEAPYAQSGTVTVSATAEQVGGYPLEYTVSLTQTWSVADA